MPQIPTLAPSAGAMATLSRLWQGCGLPPAALQQVALQGGDDGVLPSSFRVADAAQASLAAAALAAVELGALRHPGQPPQHVALDRRHATLECMARFLINGQAPVLWDKLSGLYRCGATQVGGAIVSGSASGWVRLHANFAHHRNIALRLLGLPESARPEREDVAKALQAWAAEDFEDAVAQAGGVAAAARSLAQWEQHGQGKAVAAQPLLEICRIGDAAPLRWPGAGAGAEQRPLHGLRVLELTRILAGPVAGRCLAAYGADVLLVNGPHLPNIEAIADTSRGKLSCHVDLRQAAGREQLLALTRQAHVFLQGYRPGSLERHGLSAQQLASLRPGIVVTELSAYGWSGPWAQRRGFDSLVQTATGLNLAEAQAAGKAKPQALPLQILDYAAGHLLAFGTQVALLRQQERGGSWRVRLSLAGVGHWLRAMGQQPAGLALSPPESDEFNSLMGDEDSGFGRLRCLRHAAVFSRTSARWVRPAMPPGSHAALWPESAA